MNSHFEMHSSSDVRNLLSDFEVFRTRDHDEAREWGRKVFCDNSLEYLSSDDLNAYLYYRKVGDVGLGRMSYGAEVIISPAELHSFVLFQLPIHGREQTTQRGVVTETRPGVGNFINSNSPSRVHHDDNTEKLIVRIERATLEQHCQSFIGRSLNQPLEFDARMDMSNPAGHSWMRTLRWAYDMLSIPDLSMSPIVEKQIEQSVLAMALSCQPHSFSQLLTQREPLIAPAFVRRAQDFIAANASNPISVSDIAREVGVSSRSLYDGFQRYAQTTPNQFIREFRLQRVREELLGSCASQTTITQVALQWGFGHLGHFTTAYKKRFGETPSQTLAR
ncbi:AraC family transcriptional regulator [Oceanobacter mangrovi]|uniref:AraC family transcriptional regulator n=1 Tax=Oceanobacter mangrovi TaxID=2862510 RepID=UPI001C8E6097|nr:AraC family transcriptional regulator [Oceanobacter mangrovi]